MNQTVLRIGRCSRLLANGRRALSTRTIVEAAVHNNNKKNLSSRILGKNGCIGIPYDRTFASSSQNGRTRKKNQKNTIDPFETLGVLEGKDTYADVKKKFLQIAMKHHPDTTKSTTEEEQNNCREIFIAARLAFEALVADDETGLVVLRSDKEEEENSIWSDAAMDAWFKEETGFDMPFMDQATMKEVAKMTETVGGGSEQRGLDRDGGMWELARTVAKNVQNGSDAASILQLEAGETNYKHRYINGKLRRRRKLR